MHERVELPVNVSKHEGLNFNTLVSVAVAVQRTDKDEESYKKTTALSSPSISLLDAWFDALVEKNKEKIQKPFLSSWIYFKYSELSLY